jgi:hypothetical protein
MTNRSVVVAKSNATYVETEAKIVSVRFVLSLLLIVAGIAWILFYYLSVRPDQGVGPAPEASPKAIADLELWNYAIGFGGILVGLAISAHPVTPLGRGRGVVIGMLGCFLIGLIWICTFYVFSNDLTDLPVFNDLGQWNLMVGIAFMAVGFTFATRWE